MDAFLNHHEGIVPNAPREETTIDWPVLQAPALREAFLAVVSAGKRELLPIPAKHELSIGRSRSCHALLTDPGVSRLQAILRWDGDTRFEIEDKGSKNGTRVNGVSIEGATLVGPGDEIRVGNARLAILAEADAPAEIVGNDLTVDPATQRALAVAERAATRDVTLLLVGETGVGKEVLARHIHALSPRHSGPFIAINCAAIGESLAESTLFGHERGSFTGAHARHSGVFEAASGGTLLLDEVGELSPAMQARLLRVLEERKVQRVGGTSALDVDVRILAATHRDLDEDVKRGRFRKDLLYRLAVLRVTIPPLRDRPDDIEFLAKRFLKSSGGDVLIADGALRALRAHRFEGNIRELKNLMEGALALGDGRLVTIADLPGLNNQARAHGGASRGRLDAHLEEVERDDIAAALDACQGNQSAAARRLGISRRALIYRMEKHGLKPKPASA